MGLVTLVGNSGSGKSTQMRELVKAGFLLSPNVTTRAPRHTDLAGEYTYVSDAEYSELLGQDRLLWDVTAGNGARYSKDANDVAAALTNPNKMYVHALVPSKADLLVRKYGSEVIKTVLLPSPGDDTLLERMLQRGDSAHGAAERLANEKQEDWAAQALAIDGLYVVGAHDIEQRHEEILGFVMRQATITK